MKSYAILLSIFCSFTVYADEMIFRCPEAVYIDSVVLENNQSLPFNVEVNEFNRPKAHLVGVNLYNNSQTMKTAKNDGKNYFWKELNSYHQGLNEWIYFVCIYENNVQLTKKAIYVSECNAHTVSSNDKKYLKSAEFKCE
ncbi:hypothetical protein [Gilliamella sp. wkB112]|uniref:hypothetical protein n=1 Tax=Gilliamella sp. wkB112 TaxID=3120257 RepID=UPI00080DD746|nr:hypothetical protein [Gilliamella apicola]OCG01632.1 hypothetical protein A9G12_11660 [Gilliamella apicola]